jgi:hypothetical protein
MRFISFKTLKNENGRLVSPLYRLSWEHQDDPTLGRVIAAQAPISDLEGDGGIHAGSYYVSRSYLRPNHMLFLVAPHPDATVKHDVFNCWRADHVFIVERVTSLRRAARRIVDAHEEGYDQAEYLLAWSYALLWSEIPSAKKAELLQDFRLEITRYLVRLRPALRDMVASAAGKPRIRSIVVERGDQAPTIMDWGISVGCDWPPLRAAVFQQAHTLAIA